MKRIFIFFGLVASVLFSSKANSQTFTVAHDTVRFTCNFGATEVDDFLTISSGPLAIKWDVVATNFPTEWLSGSGICDNKLCYPISNLWPSGSIETSNSYSSGLGGFHLQFGAGTSSPVGTFYLTVKMVSTGSIPDTAFETYVISYVPSAVPNIGKSFEDISLYPNPARDEINVVYDANADINVITVYNIIGKAVSVYKVNGGSANISLESLPEGIYFVRLINTSGEVVTTKKFTKQ